jgi:serine/threonine-protein kinase RsbW
MQSDSVVLRIPAKAEYITLCRLILSGIARIHGIDDETLADLKLAVTEACSNVVRHAYAAGEDGTVELGIDVLDGMLTIDVVDEGCGFELEDAPSRVFEDEAHGQGMGIAIIQELVDGFELAPTAGIGSRLRLTKELRLHDRR